MALIVIPCPDVDFTPRGKRRIRIVGTTRGRQLRWYVGGRIFRTGGDLTLAREWVGNEGAADNRPQPWELFR